MIDNLFEELLEEPTEQELKAEKKTKSKAARDLERVIRYLDQCYYENEACLHPDTGEVVSDNEYDGMRTRLEEIWPKSKIFQRVHTGDTDPTVPKIIHNPPMTSISKANGTLDEKKAKLNKWIDDVRKHLAGKYTASPNDWAVVSIKLDGIAVGIQYKDGKLVGAGLRPDDGVHGEDITANIKYVNGVPQQLPLPLTCSIRGELICLKSVFKAKQAELLKKTGKEYKNERNYTGGSIRQFKDPTITNDRGISFVGYTIEGLDNPPYKTERERAKWAREKLGIPFIQIHKFDYTQFARTEDGHQKLDFLIDGIVISVDNIGDNEQLGRHGNSPTGNPIGKLAWKFADETAEVIVKNIIWQTGRTGRITPVLGFDGVHLEGTTVTKCTAHNVGLVLNNNVYPGAVIEIVKSGKIIPKMVKVIAFPTSLPSNEKDMYPQTCPTCEGNTKKVKGAGKDMFDLICTNINCSAKTVGRLCHYLSVMGVKGLGDATVGILVDKGLVMQPADFYGLQIDDLMGADLTIRQSTLAIANIWMVQGAEQQKDNNKLFDRVEQIKQQKHIVPLSKMIASLGIIGASKGTARALGSHFANFDQIRESSMSEFEEVEDVGSITAKSLATYFSENQDAIDALLEFIAIEMPTVGKLTGRTFVFTGGFPNGKSYWQGLVEKDGGKVSSSVSKKTTDVIIGTDPGSKATKAADLGVNTMDVNELEVLLDD